MEKQITLIKKRQIQVLFWGDVNYPETLALCPDAPLLLFSKGSLQWHKERKIISLVGTRENTAYGK